MTMLQLEPPVPVITPRGKAMAHVLIDPGIEHDLQWVCFLDATGECWTVRNPDIRAQENLTMGRSEQPSRTMSQMITDAIRHAEKDGIRLGETKTSFDHPWHEVGGYSVSFVAHVTKKRP